MYNGENEKMYMMPMEKVEKSEKQKLNIHQALFKNTTFVQMQFLDQWKRDLY